MIEHIKALELRIKEKRRHNIKVDEQIMLQRQQLSKQKNMTDRICRYEGTSIQMTTMSIDKQQSSFNPNVSITQKTDMSTIRVGYQSQMSQPMETSTIEQSQQQSMVHNLYSKLITNDLETAKEKTRQ